MNCKGGIFLSISQIESKIKSLQSEITRLNKAYTDEAKKECGYLTSASRTQKSITKNTSPSMLKTKLKSISSDSEKAEKSRKKQAELQEKAAKKKTELAKQQALLQKEQDKVFQEMTKRQNEALNNQRKLVEETEKMQEEIGTKEYDFFISHAWEDKETVAKPLADALIAKGAKVWLDKYAMQVGDSLRQSIDDGLVHSRYGIVVLSEIYFKKFWTGKELNGLFAKQEEGRKVILPVWHNVSKDTVKQYSPILADMVALKTADFTIDELAEQFIQLIQ
ncbi:toll/interleukin-1 receptor domain-containing protein [Blautia glucerasea]|uniref:toll/interleukin-1 receptor domain-containing protein n=1 Tax=Blautia glucerasea TaxID=536633 RepID=UPI001FC838A0|nr:toll/interleukin-1 receptor domain-containing protein [Blautia glucerasea]